MKHPPLDAALHEIERDLYYFTKFASHRGLIRTHLEALNKAIAGALEAEYRAGERSIANSAKVSRCKS